jgi:hypothetical protein
MTLAIDQQLLMQIASFEAFQFADWKASEFACPQAVHRSLFYP